MPIERRVAPHRSLAEALREVVDLEAAEERRESAYAGAAPAPRGLIREGNELLALG